MASPPSGSPFGTAGGSKIVRPSNVHKQGGANPPPRPPAVPAGNIDAPRAAPTPEFVAQTQAPSLRGTNLISFTTGQWIPYVTDRPVILLCVSPLQGGGIFFNYGVVPIADATYGGFHCQTSRAGAVFLSAPGTWYIRVDGTVPTANGAGSPLFRVFDAYNPAVASAYLSLPGATWGVQTQVTAGVAVGTLVNANWRRIALLVQNTSANDARLGLDDAFTPTAAAGILLPGSSGASIILAGDAMVRNRVRCIRGGAADATLDVFEYFV